MDNILLFRRQFLLGNRSLEIPGWVHHGLSFGMELTAHPDLNVVCLSRPSSSLTLLGHILDANNPEASDKDILQAMHSDTDTIDSLVHKTEMLSGRWILIYANPETALVLNDAGGMRDVYYTQLNGITWCGSQPHLLAKYLNIAPDDDPDIIRYFEPDHIKSLNYKWSTSRTPYRNIYHLQPNHYLDLITSQVKRFSLTLPSELLPLHQVIEENCRILTNVMQAAHKRYSLILGCTSGFDSRVLMAANRRFSPESFSYIFQYQYMQDNHPDIRIPERMFKTLGLPFHTLRETYQADADFVQAYTQNTIAPRLATMPLIYRQYMEFPQSVNVSENTLSIIKVGYERLGKTDARKLASAYHQPHYPFILDWLQTWLQSASEAVPSDRMDISDLYYWEVYLANLISTGATEQDISIEDLGPSNCRRLLLNCFSVHPRYHTEPYSFIFHTKMIELMWKELLDFPINPNRKITLMYLLRKHNLLFKSMHFKQSLKSLRK